MNVLVDTNIFISIAEMYSSEMETYNMLRYYGEESEEPDSIQTRISNLMENNTMCICNLIRKEVYTKLQDSLQNKDITRGVRDTMRGIVQSIPNGLEYDWGLDDRVTKTNLEQQNDQRIYLTASVNREIDCILTEDHHFPPFPEGFARHGFRKVLIKRPNDDYQGFHAFNPPKKKMNRSFFSKKPLARRLLERLDRLLNIFR